MSANFYWLMCHPEKGLYVTMAHFSELYANEWRQDGFEPVCESDSREELLALKEYIES